MTFPFPPSLHLLPFPPSSPFASHLHYRSHFVLDPILTISISIPPSDLSSIQLALKHRQNKTQRQRIIILLGSPLSLSTDEKALIRLGKKLKKNNVAVDIVYFAGGAEDGAEEIVVDEGGAVGGDEGVLGRFVESVESGDNR